MLYSKCEVCLEIEPDKDLFFDDLKVCINCFEARGD